MNKRIFKTNAINNAIAFIITWPLINFFLYRVIRPNSIYIYILFMISLYLIYIYHVLGSIKQMYKTIKLKIIYIPLIGITVLLISILFNDNNNYYLKNIIDDFIIKILPAFLIALSVRDFEDLHKKIIDKAYIQFTCMIISIMYLTNFSNSYATEYSMEWSYGMLIPTLIFLSANRNKLLNKSIGTIGVISIFIYGSRGPIVCLVVFCVVYSCRLIIRSYRSALFCGGSGIVLGSIVIHYYTDIINYINRILNELGIYSRNLQMIMNFNFANSNGRNIIFNNMIEGIKERPLVGWGIRGDCYINYLYNFTGNGMSAREYSIYAHNIILEIVVQFGMIIGGAIIFYIGYLIIKGMLLTNRQSEYVLISIFFSATIIQLLVSSSYLIMINFWIYIGLSLAVINKNRSYIRLNGGNNEGILFDRVYKRI